MTQTQGGRRQQEEFGQQDGGRSRTNTGRRSASQEPDEYGNLDQGREYQDGMDFEGNRSSRGDRQASSGGRPQSVPPYEDQGPQGQGNRRSQGYWNQGYGNQSYGNQDFGNQGYGNQGYDYPAQDDYGRSWSSSQGIGSQGYPSEGYEAQGYGGMQGYGRPGSGTPGGAGQNRGQDRCQRG